jgi:hypothetical protein
MERDDDGAGLADAILEMSGADRIHGQILQSHGAMAEEYLELYRAVSGKYRKKT